MGFGPILFNILQVGDCWVNLTTKWLGAFAIEIDLNQLYVLNDFNATYFVHQYPYSNQTRLG